ncbi:MAG: CBS domain-containing protein [Methanothrix sp.]
MYTTLPELGIIRQKRKKLGLTQQFLAAKCKISQSLLAKVELGKVTPNYNIAKCIFETLYELEESDSKKAYEIMNKTVITLKPNDSISKAVGIALKRGISQFPVVENGNIIGSITTADMLDAVKGSSVSKYMSTAMPSVGKYMPVSVIKSILKVSGAVLVIDSGKIAGIITPEELL